MQRKLSGKGFSVIALLILVLVLSGIGLAGWYVWKKNQKGDVSKTDKTRQASESKNAQQELPDPYKGWQTYNNLTYGVGFKYPSDWSVEETPGNSPDSATKQEYAIALKRNEHVKYNSTITLEVLDQMIGAASVWYDDNPEPSESNRVDKTTTTLKGRQSIQYRITNIDGEARNYLFAVEDKTYVFSSVNEGLNTQADEDYWAKFNKVLDSLQLTP